MAGEEPECYSNPLNRLLPPHLQGGRIEERFETERAIVKELAEADLEPILPVYQSNPGYIALTEGREDAYVLARLQLEFALANATPGRRLAGVFLRPSEEAVGVLDWMLENPTDGKPWLGLLMLRADRQRQGLAEEVFLGLVEHLREQGYSALRAGVIETNHEGRRLTTRLGFRAVDSKKIRLGSGEQDILVLERAFE